MTAIFEAMAAALHTEPRELNNDDLLDLIQRAELTPRLLRPNGDKRKSRFAFVIHPLSQQYFKNVEPLRAITKVPGMVGVVEKAMAYAPPFVYSHVTGITSPTGAEAEGWLDHRRWHPEGDARPQPGVHLLPSARSGRPGQEARRPGHGPRRIHEGRR
ncbi:MAG: hypothetical protein V9F04_04145 [Dermatophilaceae bacterium]